MKNLKIIFLLICGMVALHQLGAAEKSREELLKEETTRVLEKSVRIAAQFYTLGEGEDLREITDEILASADTWDVIKERMIETGRRYFLFRYPSDGFQVKGYISFVPDPSGNPLLVFLRGGNRMLGLMHPATDLTCIRDYTVIATAYRGSVSEGVDQFGGDEVNDVENLVRYLPVLEQKLGLQFDPNKVFMLGGSRGGMEMFLALGRSPTLQSLVAKAASLSGHLDMRECMRYRADMIKMFIRDFGLIPEVNEKEWVNLRDPLKTVTNIRKDLPFLIVQGTNDLRVNLNEGYHMVKTLEQNGNPVDYLEIPNGDHCLGNQANRMDMIADWFELP